MDENKTTGTPEAGIEHQEIDGKNPGPVLADELHTPPQSEDPIQEEELVEKDPSKPLVLAHPPRENVHCEVSESDEGLPNFIPTDGKEYKDPVWLWWPNQHGIWNATASFDSTDDEETIRIHAPLINYERRGDAVYYTAEIIFGDKEFISPEFEVKVTDDPNSTEGSGNYRTDPEDTPAEEKPAVDPENPLNDMSERNIGQLIRQLGEAVRMMGSIWNTTANEFKLNDGIMKELYKFNSDHSDPMPDGLSEAEQEAWDRFNGIDKITEEDVERIFGKEHNIIGVTHDVTVSRIKDACSDLFHYTYALREYTNVHNAYMQLMEDQEEKYINELKALAEAEEDPEKRKKMVASIDFYYYRKDLGFLANPDEIDQEVRSRIARAWRNEKTLSYWMERSRTKMKKMKVSDKAILEISKFESRFLPEKYHKIDNILLTYFLHTTTYCKPDDKNDAGKNMSICMVMGLDRIIRNQMPPATREKVMANIIAFEEMMYKEIIGEDEPPAGDPSPEDAGETVSDQDPPQDNVEPEE